MNKNAQNILLIGSVHDCTDLEYASGFRAVDPVVFLDCGARKMLVVTDLEHGRAKRQCPGVEAVTVRDLGLTGKRWRLSDQAAALLKREGIKAVTVAPTFYHGVAERLIQKGIAIRISRKPLYPGRSVKTTEEIRKITEAQQGAVIAMRTAVDTLSRTEIDPAGFLRLRNRVLTSEWLKDLLQGVLVSHGCLCQELILAGGAQSADPHEKGSGPFRAGEPIVIDIFPQNMASGYWGDLTRTVLRGRAEPRLRRMYAAVRQAQAAALARLRAGVKGSSLYKAAAGEMEKRGFRTETKDGRSVGFIHGLGHGVGLAIHESPSLGKTSDDRLRAGNVVTVEPGLYYPELGGIRIEDTVVVTARGWKYLVPCEKRFEL
jgi:Xaa-Pro aminopeptidase